jgi:hypothetical protein
MWVSMDLALDQAFLVSWGLVALVHDLRPRVAAVLRFAVDKPPDERWWNMYHVA